MLFYYFNSKEQLFHHLVEHGIEYMTREYLNRLGEHETDFIEKYRQAAKVKMRVYVSRPHLLTFLSSLYLSNEVELPRELTARLTEITEESYARIFSNIDISLFREDLDPDRVIKLIKWSLDGYAEEITDHLRGKNLSEVDMAPFWEEFDEYLATLKTAFYRPKEEV